MVSVDLSACAMLLQPVLSCGRGCGGVAGWFVVWYTATSSVRPRGHRLFCLSPLFVRVAASVSCQLQL